MRTMENLDMFRMWVDHADRIASFHEVAEFQEKGFRNQDDYKAYVNELQCSGYRFQ